MKDESRKVSLDPEGALMIDCHICVSKASHLIWWIMEEAHTTRYSTYMGEPKINCDIRQHHSWCWMKRDIMGFMSWCLNYQQVKYENQRLGNLKNSLPIPKWMAIVVDIDVPCVVLILLRSSCIGWQILPTTRMFRPSIA